MPIRLTGVGGPLDGQVFEYGKAKSSITIGRLEDRDIRFPADFRSISRAHLAIAVENGRYYLRPEEPVFVDGEEAMRDDELPRSCELRLGTPSGPGFKVDWNVLSDMPSTQPARKRRRQTPARAARQATRGLRLVAAAAVVAVAAAAAFFALQPEPIRDRLAAARASVYLVMLRTDEGREIGYGTAWVLAPGVLATNAHVVTEVDAVQKAGGKAFVRANMPPYDTHEITGLVLHPNYLPFQLGVKMHAPVATGGRLLESIVGFDAGLLRVAPAAKLAAPLKLASPDTLVRLAAGDEVGSVGYPMEGMLAGGVNVATPAPQIHIAKITAITDFFLAESPLAERQLIQHSLPGTGGASGSPVFNARGEVIGIFSAGNLKTIGDARIPVVLINFAQRIDLVAELLDPKIEAIAAARDKVWQQRLAALPSYSDWLLQQFQSETGSKDAKPALETTLTMSAVTNAKEQSASAELEVPGPGQVLIQTMCEWPVPMQLVVREPADGGRELARKADGHHYPWVRLTPEKAAKLSVTVIGAFPSLKVGLRVLFVPKKP